MLNWWIGIVALLFFFLGLYFLLTKEFREPTFWKCYFPLFYEKETEENKLIIYRKLKTKAKTALGWYFIIVAILIFFLLTLANLQCPDLVSLSS